MLTAPRGGDRLPRGTRAYAAFRIAARWNVLEMDAAAVVGDVRGYLGAVGLLEAVPADVQLDLLAETWTRHRRPWPTQGTLLDAAVLFAACETAAYLVETDPGFAQELLWGGPGRARLHPESPERLRSLFSDFWDDREWCLVELAQDAEPARRDALMAAMGVDEREVRTLFDALARGRVSPALADNLRGLLGVGEIADCLEVIERLRG